MQLLHGTQGQAEHNHHPWGSSQVQLQLPGTWDLPAASLRAGCSPGEKLPQVRREPHLRWLHRTFLTGVSLRAQWCFQIPFPALTAINSELQVLPAELISLSSIHPHSYGTGVPQRHLNTCSTSFSECVESDPEHRCCCPHLALPQAALRSLRSRGRRGQDLRM